MGRKYDQEFLAFYQMHPVLDSQDAVYIFQQGGMLHST